MSCFSINEENFDQHDLILTTRPEFISFAVDSNELNEILRGPVRIVINNDSPISDEIKEKFNFVEYKIKETEEKYLISDPVEDISAKINDSGFFFKNRFLSFLEVVHAAKPVVSYDFSTSYCGWYFVVLPFISFIRGLASVGGKFVSGKLVHLSQSSGYGKTRLCFELLKYERRGIYCVFRSNTEGYPGTTPWMKSLINAFNETRTEEESLFVCAKFILLSLKIFGTHEIVDYKNNTTDLFEGKINSSSVINFEFDLKFEASEAYDSLILSIKDEDNSFNKSPKKKLFSLVFDECHELLINPTEQPSGLSLYRALRRVLCEIKDTGVVAVFLGTKSSLGDFVLNTRKDPSARRTGDDTTNSFNIPLYVFTQGVNVMLNEPFLLSHEEIGKTELFGTASVRHPPVLKNIMMRCGRPLWAFFRTFEESYNVALHKLKCESSLFELTCFILRTGTSVVPQDQLAHKLVLSCMATLVNVDIEGSSCRVEYVPEPMLSNVARNVLLNINNYDKAIKEYLRRLQLGTFHDTGEAGEFIGRIVLLRAMDLALLKPQTGSSKFTEVVAFNGKRIFGAENSEHEKTFDKYFKALNPSTSQSNIVVNSIQDMLGSNVDANSDEVSSMPDYPQESLKLNQESESMIGSGDGLESVQSHDCSGKQSPINDSKSYISPSIGVATLREFLVLLSSVPNEDLSAFGVSDAVLDGFITINQFVKLENPLKMDQAYLMHGFARSIAFILPDRTPGLDLMIPVLRTDNRMSCVAIQVKNFSSEAFPDKVKDVTQKLSRFYLNYLDFGPIGSFDAAPADDFIRVVIQFREHKELNQPIDNLYCWTPISDSESQIDPNNVCNALWLCGLDSFEKSLFFNHGEIIKNLNTILSSQRDFLNAIDFPDVQLPSRLQTSEQGARFLVSCARPLSKRSNLISEDVSLQKNNSSYDKNYLETLKNLNIPKFAKEYQSSLTFTTKKEVADQIKAKNQKVSKDVSNAYEKDAEMIITKIEIENSQYEFKSEMVDEKKKFNDNFRKNCEKEKEEFKNKLGIRKVALQGELEQLLKHRTASQQTVAGTKNVRETVAEDEPEPENAGQKRRTSPRLATIQKSKKN